MASHVPLMREGFLKGHYNSAICMHEIATLVTICCLQSPTQSIGVDLNWLLNESMLVLQTQLKANKPDQGYMAGALAGLSSALTQCKVLCFSGITIAFAPVKFVLKSNWSYTE